MEDFKKNNSENWRVDRPLGDVVEDIFLGLSLSRQPKGQKLSLLPMVNARDIEAGFLPSRSQLQDVELPEGSQTDRFRLRPGDVVISARGSFKVAGVRLEHDGAVAGANLIVVRPGEALAAPLVLAFLRHPLKHTALAHMSVGTTVPSINVGAVAALRVVVPPLEQQAQLSKLVELADEHYAAARKAAELRHEIAQRIAIRSLTL